MSIYDYEGAFEAADITTKAMRNALEGWLSLYYQQDASQDSDPCQRIPYIIVNKIVKTVFGEYKVSAKSQVLERLISRLDKKRKEALQMALVAGECYIKPCPGAEGFGFTLVPRNNVLIFGRDPEGAPVDMGTVEKTVRGNYYYTLLERRTVDENGYLTIENRLFRSTASDKLGNQVSLGEHPDYSNLAVRYRYPTPIGSVGLARLKTPMLNCVDGSFDGVAVFAPAVGLIENINRNEAQMNGEFSRGESRIIASSDLLGRNSQGDRDLTEHLFVGLDEDPEQVGITVFSPKLREASFLARKHEYLRNVESIIGLRRGMLSDANIEDRTATEIASSAGDYNLTVIDFQEMWENALRQTVEICAVLAQLYRLEVPEDLQFSVDWGNGILYDEGATWEAYREMVTSGMLKPEVALGWRFNMPAETQEQLAAIRERYMPAQE